MKWLVATAMVICVGLGACNASNRGGAEAPTGAEDEAKELLEKNMTGPRTRGLASCPSAVPGATTEVRNAPDGVELVITSPGEGGARQIRFLARRLAGLRPAADGVRHSGEGTGSGTLGYCPVVIAGTDVVVEDVAGGARVIVKARHPELVGALQLVTRSRADALSRGYK